MEEERKMKDRRQKERIILARYNHKYANIETRKKEQHETMI